MDTSMDTSSSQIGVAGSLIGISQKLHITITIAEADNGFILSWYDKKENTKRIHLALTLEAVGVKFSELFSK